MPLPQPTAQDDTLSELLKLVNRQLTEKNLKIEKASAAVIDATIIQTAGSKQRQAIEVDEEGQVSGQTTPSKDSDARWIKKELDETGDSSLWKRIYLPAKATGGCTHGYWRE